HDGGIRVPGIARWPGKVEAGATSDLPWYFADFLPTACQLAGTEVPPGIDGISIVPTLLGKGRQRRHEFMYWEFHEGRTSKQAVRMGHWKAVRTAPSAPIQLYDLRTDLAEANNVAADRTDVVAKIADYLKTARTESKVWPLRDVREKPR
ncbi:MAG: sulfatase/phosphatase domain-containing protein, partial [Planctomycetota bacterium]